MTDEVEDEDPDITKDDKVFEYLLIDVLKPYTLAAREWWKDLPDKSFTHCTTMPIKTGPPGFFERVSKSPRISPVYGVQAFPVVMVSSLNLPHMLGGAVQLVEYICKKGFIIEEFTLISKVGLHSTFRQGLFLCYIPTELLKGAPKPRWVYMRPNEILELACGIVTKELAARVLPFAQEYKGDVVK